MADDPHDPMLLLHRTSPVATPRAAFAASLRERLEDELRRRGGAPSTHQPKGIHPMPNTATTVVSYLCTNDAKAAIEFYTAGFGAVETMRLVDPKDGRIGHMEFRIGETTFFMADEYPEIGVLSPLAMPGTAVSFVIDVPDADALFARAVAAGATVERAMADQFHGNRTGSIRDPFGHRWMISSHIEDVQSEEMQRRYDDGGEEA